MNVQVNRLLADETVSILRSVELHDKRLAIFGGLAGEVLRAHGLHIRWLKINSSTQRKGFRTLIELKLRQSGIPVDGGEHLADPYYTTLYLSLNNFSKNGLICYDVDLKLTQFVDSPTAFFKKGSGREGPANGGNFEAWGPAGMLGITGASRAVDDIKRTVGGLVDRFCNDWLKANPKS